MLSSPLQANPQQETFFTDHLSAFSGARTNPYAIQCAAQICKDFKLSVGGQRRLNKALNELPCIEAQDPKLSFAWSMEHVIRSPRVHQFGYEHLTIIITLAECFHETYGAEVIHQMAKKLIPAEQGTPHIYQWLDLLHFCNGILATDDFSTVVEGLVLLDPYSVTPGGKYSSDRCLVPPESVADALIALSELTSGKRDTLSLRGGGVIGWIAALAEIFFGLTATIESKEHTHLHGPVRDAQLNLIYTEKPELIIEDTSIMATLTNEVSVISLAPYLSQIHFLPYGGRVMWANFLQQVFGKSSHDLETHASAMYAAIGTAFRAIEEAKDSSSISPKQGPHTLLSAHPPEPNAKSLIERLTAHLSSLQRGQAKMERQLRLTSQEAAKVHFEQRRYLAEQCGCKLCHNLSGRTDAAASPKVSSDRAALRHCLLGIVETVIMVGLMLSRIIPERLFNPSREGVQLLYKLRTDKFPRATNDENILASPNAVAALYDNVPQAPTSYILRMAVKFFAGGHLPPLGSDLLPLECVALAHEGMCAFASELVGGKGVRRDMKGMVRVVNGGIGIGSKSYRLVAWSNKRPGGREGWQWDEIMLQHLPLSDGTGRLWLK